MTFDSGAAAVLECAAFPHLLRRLAVVIMVALVIGVLAASLQLQRVAWTLTSLLLFGLAWVYIAWVGYWILRSRTRLVGDEIVQTWLWTKRAKAADVATMRLVHWPWADALMAPRMLVRQRGGAIQWFQAEDAQLLRSFMALVVERQTTKPR